MLYIEKKNAYLLHMDIMNTKEMKDSCWRWTVERSNYMYYCNSSPYNFSAIDLQQGSMKNYMY